MAKIPGMAANGRTQRVRGLIELRCPACGTEVVSPSLGQAEMLDRHLRHCRWEPGDLGAA